MKKLLYFYPIKNSFVESDFDLLAKHYSVKCFSFAVKRKAFTPIAFLQQLFFLFIHLPSASVMVSQFSGYHSFLPSLFGRIFRCNHFIIVHGTECNNFPEYRYGYKIRPLLFWFSRQSLSLAYHILPVSEALIEQSYTYMNTSYQKQGLRAFYPGLNTPVEVIYNGVSEDRFTILPDVERVPGSFVTVATGLNDPNRRGIKGLDLICALAEKYPEGKFTFIGGSKSSDLSLPSNIKVVPPVPNEALSSIYNQHQYYLQLSVSEGFGISVVEAMMSGCIPIVSTAGVLPKIAGDFGFVLPQKSIDALLALIEQANLTSAKTSLDAMRAYVVKEFAIKNREQLLLRVLSSD